MFISGRSMRTCLPPGPRVTPTSLAICASVSRTSSSSSLPGRTIIFAADLGFDTWNKLMLISYAVIYHEIDFKDLLRFCGISWFRFGVRDLFRVLLNNFIDRLDFESTIVKFTWYHMAFLTKTIFG